MQNKKNWVCLFKNYKYSCFVRVIIYHNILYLHFSKDTKTKQSDSYKNVLNNNYS